MFIFSTLFTGPKLNPIVGQRFCTIAAGRSFAWLCFVRVRLRSGEWTAFAARKSYIHYESFRGFGKPNMYKGEPHTTVQQQKQKCETLNTQYLDMVHGPPTMQRKNDCWFFRGALWNTILLHLNGWLLKKAGSNNRTVRIFIFVPLFPRYFPLWAFISQQISYYNHRAVRARGLFCNMARRISKPCFCANCLLRYRLSFCLMLQFCSNANSLTLFYGFSFE